MTKLNIKYQITTIALSRWAPALRGLFSNSPNLINRDTYLIAKANKSIWIKDGYAHNHKHPNTFQGYLLRKSVYRPC